MGQVGQWEAFAVLAASAPADDLALRVGDRDQVEGIKHAVSVLLVANPEPDGELANIIRRAAPAIRNEAIRPNASGSSATDQRPCSFGISRRPISRRFSVFGEKVMTFGRHGWNQSRRSAHPIDTRTGSS